MKGEEIMCQIKLVIPDKNMKNEAIEFKNEFFDNGEKTINGSFKWDGLELYDEWLKIVKYSLSSDTANPKWGVITTFFGVRKSDGKIVGIINLRHSLTEKFIHSGHIGYSIRPSERMKGYATEMLKQLLVYAKNQGLEEVDLVCKSNNTASIKTILKNV